MVFFVLFIKCLVNTG